MSLYITVVDTFSLHAEPKGDKFLNLRVSGTTAKQRTSAVKGSYIDAKIGHPSIIPNSPMPVPIEQEQGPSNAGHIEDQVMTEPWSGFPAPEIPPSPAQAQDYATYLESLSYV